jgi:alcohol dehydrogenase
MAKVIAFELEIRGSLGMLAFRYQAMMGMISTGKLKPELLVGRKYTLDEAPAALAAMGEFDGIGIGVVTRF